ncbi:45 kDa calcium-binding protein [Halyomorpha halys]|uniref:45 kDa calcium-binding protein n=1 Tax=Halyomorpha halys TaxID=286706 RepID=UPI0006D5203A|nr:45 kDa calcium-binding protein [Halyomorpha halys]XP_014290090.1 45 kDa calcium-binding protein [Halyomorpha halys]
MFFRKLNARHFSIVIPFLFYVILLGLVYKYSIPLKSETKPKNFMSILEKIRKKKHDIKKDSVIELQEVSKRLPPVQLLTTVFKKVDVDGNDLLTLTEISEYIHKRTTLHIEEAMKENFGLFMSIDKNPRNGVISWSEYHAYFLLTHGVDEEYIRNHPEKHPGLGRSLKETIARDKASWSEAAKSDPDFLTLDEFLAFRHPESSHATLLTLVDDLLDKLDRDGDEMLTEEEFAVLQVSGGETLVSQGEVRRRAEFRNVIDTDSNSLADRHELLNYIDPRNPRHAREESETLVTLADTDHDGKLSLQEVLAKMDLFLGSKMIDTARSFHDEF